MKRAAILMVLVAMAACGGGGKPVAKDMKVPAAVAGFVSEKFTTGDPGISFTSAADDYYSFIELGPKGSGGVVPGSQVGEPVSHTQQTYPVGTSGYYWHTEITVGLIAKAAGTGGCGAGADCVHVIFTSSVNNDANHPCLLGDLFLSEISLNQAIIGTAAAQGWYYPGAMFPGYFGLDSHNAGAGMLFWVGGNVPNPSTGSLHFSNGAGAVIRNVSIIFPDGGPYARPSTAWIWVSVEDPTGTWVYNEYSVAAINPG